MHEQHLMEELMAEIAAVAAREGAARVIRVRVWVGALSHLSAAGFRSSFARLAAGGVAEDAVLELTVSEDLDHPRARGVVLESVDVAGEA